MVTQNIWNFPKLAHANKKKNKIGETKEHANKILSCFPGNIGLVLQEPITGGFDIEINQESITQLWISCDIECIESRQLTLSVQTIVVLFPWAYEILKQSDFLEMDASFKGSKPYTFCLQSAIYSNESYPLELSIYPSESQQLYSAFVQFGKIIGIQEEEWKEKVLLSDMGGSLISFAKEYLHDYYFCERHIIELFGPCSGLYTFVRKILRYASFEEYEFKRHLIIQQVKFYKKKDMCNPKINTIFEQKYKTLLKMLNSDETSRNSIWHYSRSATWTRKEFHVATCSNHCENLHSCLKKRNENNTTFLTKISNLMKKIIHHVINIPVNSGNSLKQKMQNRKSYVVSKLRGFKGSYKFFTNDLCQCKKVEFLTQLYRTRIPCKNKVLCPCLSQIEKMELKDNVVNDIIIQTLEGDISNKQQIRNQLLSKYQF